MKIILFFALLFWSAASLGQKTILVQDKLNKQPIPAVYLLCNGQQVAVSNLHGEIELPSDISCQTVVLSHISYKNIEIFIDGVTDRQTIFLTPSESQLDEVLVTATPFHRIRSAIPGSISVLEGDLLQTGQQTDIRPHLEQIPGIQMQAGALNTARLTIRGIGSRTPYASNRIKAYYEDIPLTSGDGATIVEDLEINEMGKVEVIKGPSSALYGPGLGGTIVIRSAPIPLGWNVTALTETGSFNLLRGGISLSHRDSASYLSSAFYRTTMDGYRQNSRYERSNFIVRGGVSLNRSQASQHKLTFFLNHVDLMAQIPSSIDRETYLSNPRSAAANWLAIRGYQSYNKWQAGVSLQSQLTPLISNRIAIYGIYNDAYEPRPFNTLDELTKTIGVRQQLLYSGNSISLSLGGELFTENYQWKIFETIGEERGEQEFHSRERRNYYNLFAHAEKEFETGTIVTAGVNLHQLFYRTNVLFPQNEPVETHRYSPVISPRVAVNQRLWTGNYLFASVGHGFSAPSPEEALLPDGSINRDLQPEEGINYEGGIRSSLLSNRLNLDITAYRINIQNLLMTRRDAEDVFYGENAGKTTHYGIESSAFVHITNPLLFPEHSLRVTHTLMRNKFGRFEQDDLDFRNKKLPGLPGSSLNISMTNTLLKNLSLNTSFQHISRQYLNDANTISYSGHELIDLSLNYRYTNGWIKDLRVSTGVQNLLDRHHASMVLVNAPSFGTTPPRYFYPGLPRRFFVNLRVNI
ncbi:TonB-dependent receptor [Natronoflexus pectinivorans]|nr:TonB-dependent receptor [Natronoflexus pectinivorans]